MHLIGGEVVRETIEKFAMKINDRRYAEKKFRIFYFRLIFIKYENERKS